MWVDRGRCEVGGRSMGGLERLFRKWWECGGIRDGGDCVDETCPAGVGFVGGSGGGLERELGGRIRDGKGVSKCWKSGRSET